MPKPHQFQKDTQKSNMKKSNVAAIKKNKVWRKYRRSKKEMISVIVVLVKHCYRNVKTVFVYRKEVRGNSQV